MASEWKEVPASEFCDSVRDGTHDSPKKVESGKLLVTSRHIAGNRLDLSSAYKISNEDYEEINRRSKVDQWDVLFTMIGTVGEPCLVSAVPNYAIKNVGLFKNKTEMHGKYLYYYLCSPEAQHHTKSHSGGTTQQYIPLGALRKFPVRYPEDENEMLAITNILGSLDDKIELNRRMNETLEGMAQALFKSWFVDFDPVIDNALEAGNPIPEEFAVRAETRRKALADGTANREAAKNFPAAFQETGEISWIPEGWEVGQLDDILQQRVERVKASEETTKIPYVPIECISPKSLFLENVKDGAEAQSSLTKFYKGDILFGAMRPYFHKVCISPFDGTTRTTAFVLTCADDSDFAYGTALVNQKSTIDYATLHSEGSTIPYAKWKNSLERMPVILPPNSLRGEYGNKIDALLSSIPPKYYQNVTLTKLRDTLLPKLISGELRIKDAENMKETI